VTKEFVPDFSNHMAPSADSHTRVSLFNVCILQTHCILTLNQSALCF